MLLYIFNHWDADEEESLIWAASIQLCSPRALGRHCWRVWLVQGMPPRCKLAAREEEKPDLCVWELGWNNGEHRDLLGELSKLHGSASRDSKGQRGSAWFQEHPKPGKSWLSLCHCGARGMIAALQNFQTNSLSFFKPSLKSSNSFRRFGSDNCKDYSPLPHGKLQLSWTFLPFIDLPQPPGKTFPLHFLGAEFRYLFLCLHGASSLIRMSCWTQRGLQGVPPVICLQMSG